MRADRLIALALLLQARGRMTAEDLAQRLEVSVRTVYRDLDALSAAGVPVYAECGRGGGTSLPDGYRLDLTALNKEEARVLFLGAPGLRGVGLDGTNAAGAAGPLADLGVGAVLDGALRKLTAALPAGVRDEAEWARQRLLVDTEDWWSAPENGGGREGARAAPSYLAHLRAIEQAVWQDRRLRMTYPRRVRPGGSVTPVDGPDAERVVDPYALVAKRGVWYLVAAPATEFRVSRFGFREEGGGGHETRNTGRETRVYRVSRIRAAEVLDGPSRRPADFDLQRFWAEWCGAFVQAMPSYWVTVRASPRLARELARNPIKGGAFPARVGATDADGWVTMELDLEAPVVALGHLLAYGAEVEVLAPPELRERMAAAARDMAALYTGRPES